MPDNPTTDAKRWPAFVMVERWQQVGHVFSDDEDEACRLALELAHDTDDVDRDTVYPVRARIVDERTGLDRVYPLNPPAIDLSGATGALLVALNLLMLELDSRDDRDLIVYAVAGEAELRGWPDGWYEDPSILSPSLLQERREF